MDAKEYELKQQIMELYKEIARLKKTLGTLINWMAQSANSPIRRDEAGTLLNTLDGVTEDDDES